ncbi:hypothetical protein BC830DRAFT_1151458 [Chytriomyces sp. MP71]|nr:hypothetical protein BC830DRAFT_1151458 [Chytriomyces sp. MP71]
MTQKWLRPMKNIVQCPLCGSPSLLHHSCKTCLRYSADYSLVQAILYRITHSLCAQGAEERSVTSIHTRGELMTAGNARHARSK